MGAFDCIWTKEPLIRKTIEIDDNLYSKLQELSQKKYDASVNKLINACILELVNTKNINLYKPSKDSIPVKHSLLIRASLVEELDKLKSEFNLSLYKLVNISIKNAIDEITR